MLTLLLRRAGVLLLLLLVGTAGVQAETLYVTDILRLGLHRAQDTSDRAFRTLVSGTALEVLERTGNYARVRTPDGTVGWVKANYLVVDKPAQLIVGETNAKVEALTAELDEAKAALSAAEEKAAQLENELNQDENSARSLQARLTTALSDSERYQRELQNYRGSLPLTWVVVALLLVLIGGFMAGLWWIDYQSRKRHGGFRVY